MEIVSDNCISKTNQKEVTLSVTKSLEHTKWNCKYHVVFPQIASSGILGRKEVVIGKILRKLCEWKEIYIVEAECCPDHIYMLLEIPPKISVSSFMS